MVGRCADNNLELNMSKTKEMIVDFRRKKTPIRPHSLNGVEVEQVESFKFLGTISSDPSWDKNTLCIIKKAQQPQQPQQRLYFLRQLRRLALHSFSITLVWLRRPGETAARSHCEGRIQNLWERVAILESIYHARCACKSRTIARDTTHPANHCMGYNPPSQPLQGIQPTQPTTSLSFFPLVNLQKHQD